MDEQLSLTAHNSKGSVKRSRKLNTLQKKKKNVKLTANTKETYMKNKVIQNEDSNKKKKSLQDPKEYRSNVL